MKPIASWHRKLAPYTVPATLRSVGQLSLTLGMLAAVTVTAFAAARISALASLPLSAVAGILLVRIFIIQHDCGHRSFLGSAAACDAVGRALSVLTLTPYDSWRRAHDRHHASSGDLDRRGFGDIDTKTVQEYEGMSFKARLGYRIYRHPAVMFGFGPAWLFLLLSRVPKKISGKWRRSEVVSVLATDFALVCLFGTIGLFTGYGALALVWLPSVLVAATVGVWLFFVQHQFEDTYWERRDNWDYVEAALHGCSFYRMPAVLHWATGWIGYHHIHHLSSRIPNYRLAQAFRELPELREARTLSVMQSLASAHLALWCERRKRLVAFSEAFPVPAV